MSRLKKLYILILTTIIAIILGSSTVSAVWFSGWKNGNNPLWTSREYYCVEHQDYFTAGDWNPISTWTINSDDASHPNRILANILYNGIKTGQGGYNGRGEYQWAVWKWFYDNGRVNTEPVSSARYNLAYKETINPTPYSSGNAGLSVADNQVTMEGNVGSIKINSISGKVDKVEIIWKDPTDNKEYKKTITSGNNKEAGWVEFYSDKDCTKPININDFKVGTIYVKNLKENYDVKNINIHVTNSASGYSVTVTRWRKSTGQASQQDLISATMKEGTPTDITIPLKVKYTYGELKIIKKGVYKEDGKSKEQNITANFKLYCSTLNKWVAGDANGNKTYVDSIDKATTYKSSIIVKRLLSSYKYQLVEVAVNNNYYNNPIKMVAVTSDLQKGLKVTKKDNYYASSNVIVYSNRTNTVTVLDERTSGNLVIIKADDTHSDIKLQGAKFKIYCKDKGWLIQNSNGTYKYDGDIKSATEFTSNEKGEVQIKCVKFGTYYAYETVTPEGYDITKQDGYENNNGKDPYSYSKDNKWVYLGELKIDSSNNTAKYTLTNKKIVNLEGKVWIDNPDRKENGYNNIYDDKDWAIQEVRISKDELKKGIKVYLKNSENKTIAETITDEKGHYEFKNLNYWDLAKCYVEFAYDNKQYVIADPFIGNDTKINSKAIEEVMTKAELEDERLTGIDGETPGRAITYKGGSNLTATQILENNKAQNKDLTKTPLTGYYNNTTYTIEDVNLGIKEKHEPTYTISENLEYVKVRINGYTYKYQHGPNAGQSFTYTPKVATQISGTRFSQILYPSDIAYKSDDASKELSVFVVYSIAVKNNETTYIDDIYNEQTLYLNSLVNNYDNERYELCTDENKEDSSDFGLWKVAEDADGNKYATYDIENGKFKAGIKKGETISSQIQFKINKDHLRKMLERTEDAQNGLENAPTVAKANAYHEYLRTDNVWNENNSSKAFDGIKGKYDEKNKANETYFAHKSVSKEEVSSNVFIDIMLGESRKISGVVFEDVALKDSNLGNGTLDGGENNRAKDVRVELLDIDKETIAKLYQVDKVNNYVVKLKSDSPKDGIEISKENGTYSFDGVVPGYYFIRFTYGDGKQLMMPANEVITSKNYKSTIIKNKDIQEAMEAKTQDEAMKLADWYKKQETRNNSAAVDDLSQRKIIDGYTYNADGTITDKDGKIATDIMNINSYTPMIGISVEDDKEDVKEIKHDENGNDITEYKNEFTGFNFGLIKHPDTPVKVEKKITDVKFTNQVGTTLVSENPVSKQSTYVTALDKIEGGSKYAKLEIEPENIYGSNIELTYEIKMTNNADFDDYTEESYYKYGESGKTKKTIQVQVLEDDLDNKFNYASLPKTTTQTKSSTSGDSNVITLEPVTETINNPDGTTTTKEYIKMTGWDKLARNESTSTSYTVTALVANDDTDPAYNNDAKVQSLSVDTLTTLTTESLKKWEGDKTVFTITPTTGENRNQTYIYIGAVALAIIASGLILIKKKVL